MIHPGTLPYSPLAHHCFLVWGLLLLTLLFITFEPGALKSSSASGPIPEGELAFIAPPVLGGGASGAWEPIASMPIYGFLLVGCWLVDYLPLSLKYQSILIFVSLPNLYLDRMMSSMRLGARVEQVATSFVTSSMHASSIDADVSMDEPPSRACPLIVLVRG